MVAATAFSTTRTVGVVDRRVRKVAVIQHKLAIKAPDQLEDRIAALRIPGDGNDVTMVGRHDDQCLLLICRVHCRLHRFVESDGLSHHTTGTGDMAGVIHSLAFDHQEVTLVITGKIVDGSRPIS